MHDFKQPTQSVRPNAIASGNESSQATVLIELHVAVNIDRTAAGVEIRIRRHCGWIHPSKGVDALQGAVGGHEALLSRIHHLRDAVVGVETVD
jgi:hypothetical protein